MVKGILIIRVGIVITAVTLLLTHSIGLPHGLSAFFMGMGCSLSLVGAGKRFVEMGGK